MAEMCSDKRQRRTAQKREEQKRTPTHEAQTSEESLRLWLATQDLAGICGVRLFRRGLM